MPASQVHVVGSRLSTASLSIGYYGCNKTTIMRKRNLLLFLPLEEKEVCKFRTVGHHHEISMAAEKEVTDQTSLVLPLKDMP